ncbi:TPA: type VI secretion system Vgr family protein [Acinetobacter baumannii]|uniref:type VI secretion system Vgr family protein n=3 Tax=Acinetobacter baumannii TaxID=470 RepID=UPI00046E25F9|nr:type VI secretion system Vgr family protein [Acinetobacter baumannii]KRJ37608.1 type VI secretion system protein [Acinetobacter baumannii]MCX3036100.1 type VI secretion system Vgr family protein [Acinetobacter baumannii]MDC4455167.1 type VI secretion system tip protein VgrG [Acinetobacter baumannii]MDC5445430.1 type VI secretion system tip protein VgrG [Acinetobacter baumannii]OFD27443.1 type VI secretion system protein [Acinetobacter baumannii]
MFNNISQILESVGFLSQHRSVYLQFSDASLNSQVFLQRIDGQHYLNQGTTAELICLSTNAHISLKTFIGVQVAVDQVTDRGSLFRTTGIITGASQGQSDGALTLYKLTISDPTYLWHKRRNSRVFMNKSVKEISEILFQEWQGKSPLFASSLTLDLSGLKQTYDVRPFVMQLNESDYDFLTRLWRSEGINWLIDEAELTVPSNTDHIQPQKLRLIDDNNQYQALTRRTIRYHRSHATEQFDSMTSLKADRSLQPTSVFVQRWQSDVLEQTDGAGSVQSKHQHSSNYDNQSLSLEDAWHFSPAWMQDLKGEDGATSASNQQLEKFNQNLSAYYAAQSKQFIAKTTVRDTQVGYWFELNEHPEIDLHDGADKEFLIIGKHYYNQNNLPKDLNQQIQALVQQSHWQASQTDERQGNELILQRRNIKVVPAYQPLQHRPKASVQRARVVGPEGEQIYVDQWGRIKVRFLFTRADDHRHDGGAGSNDNDTDSAWVDVLTPWAGKGYGARFLPRVGEIVVIDFFDGNVDRPFVAGRIHEAERYPTQFDQKGHLPDTKKLSGIRSEEVGGKGFNQLRLDDTTGQISAQLQSSHAASQLNLGNLSHPKDKAESDGRGEGFELRTDQWGAVRAGKGLLITTHKQDQAQGTHLDAADAKQQIEGGLNNAKALSEVAKNQQTDPLEVLDNLKTFLEQIKQQDKDKAAAFKQALMVLTAPNSIAVASNEDIHLSADGQLSQSAGDSINISTQKNLIAHAQNKISLFAAQQGARLYAGKGKVEIQAQGDGADLIARKGIQIISTEDKVEISASKEIVITAGSSQIKINGSGIFPVTGGKFEVKAGQHVFMGGASASIKSSLPPPPKRAQGVLELLHDYSHGAFVKGAGYTVTDNLGKVVNGKLDDKGFARVSGLATGSVKVLFDPDPRNPWDEASDFKRKVEWPNQNDVEGSIGIASGSKGLTETLKNDFKKLSQLAGNVKSVQQKIESVKRIKDQGAKALLPMATEQILGGSDGSKLNQSFVSQNSFMPASQQSNPLRRLAQAGSNKTAITKIQSPFETFV